MCLRCRLPRGIRRGREEGQKRILRYAQYDSGPLPRGSEEPGAGRASGGEALGNGLLEAAEDVGCRAMENPPSGWALEVPEAHGQELQGVPICHAHDGVDAESLKVDAAPDRCATLGVRALEPIGP